MLDQQHIGLKEEITGECERTTRLIKLNVAALVKPKAIVVPATENGC